MNDKKAEFGEPPIELPVDEIKALVRHRDGYRCMECGMTATDHVEKCGRNLEVHRIAPGSEYTLAGCVTLCKKCHGRKPKSPRGHGDKSVLSLRLDPETAWKLEEIRKFLAVIPGKKVSAGEAIRLAIYELAVEHGLR